MCADGVDCVRPAGKHFVNVALVRNIKEKFVLRAIRDTV